MKITDRKILNTIYEYHYDDFLNYSKEQQNRKSKNHIPIDLQSIADDLDMDIELLWGRLYYHLDKKYSFHGNNETTHLFVIKIGEDRNAINFPLLSAIAAELNESHKRFTIPIVLSIVAVIVSVTSVLIKS